MGARGSFSALERKRKRIIFVVSAPSGAGKTTVCRLAIRGVPGIRFSTSHTTRPRRGSERNGIDYHFASDAEFDRMLKRREFVEWAFVYGHRYGTSFAELDASRARGHDILLEIDTQGALKIRRRYPDAVLVFILPPDFAELRRRLVRRGTDSPREVVVRLKRARSETMRIKKYDYFIVNDRVQKAVAELKAVFITERQRISRSVD
jgi:guanylate kinase